MTQDDIIRMAVTCQLITTANREGIYMKALERFAALVRADEREACAKVCENIYEGDEACGDWPSPEQCAAAIRARGEIAPTKEIDPNQWAFDNGLEST